MTLGAIFFVVLMELLLPLVSVASATDNNQIDVTPAIINLSGQVNITLTTVGPAVGTIKVTQNATGESWLTPVNQPAGPTQYVFPSGIWIGATPPNTNVEGSYDVLANITIKIFGDWVWSTKFQVEFFVVPELPLGVLMATIASFAAWGMLRKYKTRQ